MELIIQRLITVLKEIRSLKPEECEGCGIWTDGLLERLLMNYRGHRLCSWCALNWRRRGEREGRALSFYEYTSGKLEV